MEGRRRGDNIQLVGGYLDIRRCVRLDGGKLV